MLLDNLIKDEKKINRLLYSSGPYWDYKNSRSILEIKKKGLSDFRGTSAGIGTSFADNLVVDIRNEFNTKGRLISKIFSLPILNKVFNGQLNLTQNYINNFIKIFQLTWLKAESRIKKKTKFDKVLMQRL